MRSTIVLGSIAAIGLSVSINAAQAKEIWVGQLGCDLTDRPKTPQNSNLEITCVFNPNRLGLHQYYMGKFTPRTDVAKQTAGVMHWDVYTSQPEAFKGISGQYILKDTLSGSAKHPASAALVGGRLGAVVLRPTRGHFDMQRNFAGHLAALTLIWGGSREHLGSQGSWRRYNTRLLPEAAIGEFHSPTRRTQREQNTSCDFTRVERAGADKLDGLTQFAADAAPSQISLETDGLQGHMIGPMYQ